MRKTLSISVMGSLSWPGAVQGLSEPVGALIALLFVKPFLTPLLLQYMLAFVGGIMVGKALPTAPQPSFHSNHLCFRASDLLLQQVCCQVRKGQDKKAEPM